MCILGFPTIATTPPYIPDHTQHQVVVVQQMRKMHPKKKILMPPTFAPHHFSVVIGKGRDARDAPGTKILRSEIFNKLAVYRKCSRRLEKAQIVSDLLREQQRRCPGGGAFVKHDGERWWELSEHDARENITAAFRNRLHENYTSSSKFKSAKRRMQLKTNGDVPRRETVVSVIKHIEPEESKCKISPIKSLSSNDTIREEKVTLLPAVSVEGEIWNQHALNILRACMLRTNDIEHAADMQSSSCNAVNERCEQRVENQGHDERILTSTTSSSDHSCTTLALSTKVNNPNDWVSRMVSSSECEEDNDSSMDSPPISFSPAKITCMSSDDAMESWCKHVRMEPQHLMNNQSFASVQTSWDCSYSPSAVSSRRDDFFVAALTNSRRFSWLFRADPIMFSQEEELLEPVDPTMFDERLTTIH